MFNDIVQLDRPIVQPILIDINYPPYVPENILVQPEIKNYLPQICGLIINEVVTNVNKNRTRLLLFNLVSENYYRNDVYREIVELTTGFIYTEVRKGKYRTFESAVSDCISRICSLYSSYLVFKYPQIKPLIPSELINAALQNIQSFNNLKEEVRAMFAHNNNYPPQNYVNNTYTGGGMVQSNQMHYGNQMPHIASNTAGASMFVDQRQFIVRADNQLSGTREERYSKLIKPDQREMNYPNGNISRNVEQEYSTPKPDNELHLKTEVLEMQHSCESKFANSQVSFLSNSVHFNNEARSSKHWSSINDLSNEKLAEDCSNNFYLKPTVLLETNIDNAVISGRIKQYEIQKNAINENLFRVITILTNPFFSTYNLTEYHRVLQTCNNFEGLIGKIRSIGMALSKHNDKEYITAVITYLNVIDQNLTNLINDFLRNKINIDVSIEGFCEDAVNLKLYLYNKDSLYAEAYETFEQEIINSMFTELDEETLTLEAEEMQVPEGLNFYLFPVMHTLTYTFLNNKELGMKIGDSLYSIDVKRSPSLYKLVSGLFKQKKENEINSAVDYLITIDNFRYKLYKDSCKEKIYYIRKA